MYVECQTTLWMDVKMNGRAMLGRALTLVIIGSLSEIKKEKETDIQLGINADVK